MRHILRQMQIRTRACILHRIIGMIDWLTTNSRVLGLPHITLLTNKISIGETKRRDLPGTSGGI